MNSFIQQIKDCIIENGWTKYELQSVDGSICLLGAANIVDHNDHIYRFGDLPQLESKLKPLIDVVKENYELTAADILDNRGSTLPQDILLLVRFNNAKETTKEKLFEVLDRAIETT